jgi:hypothetical protein
MVRCIVVHLGLQVKEQYQTLMMNLEADDVGLSFFKATKGVQGSRSTKRDLDEARLAVHEFFEAFSTNNKVIQATLFDHLPIFIEQVNISMKATSMLISIFRENSELCKQLDNDQIQMIMNAIHSHGRSVQSMELLKQLVKPTDECLNTVATMVIDTLSSVDCEDLLLLYHFGDHDHGTNEFTTLMQNSLDDPNSNEYAELQYHVALITLLAVCTEGKNLDTERTCQSFLPLDDVIVVITHDDAPPNVKTAYLEFLNHCYLDVELHETNLVDSHGMWDALECFTRDIDFFFDVIGALAEEPQFAQQAAELRVYIHSSVMSTIENWVKVVLSTKAIRSFITEKRLNIIWGVLANVAKLATQNKEPLVTRTLKLLAQLGRRLDMRDLNPNLERQIQNALTSTAKLTSKRPKDAWKSLTKGKAAFQTFGQVITQGMDHKHKEAKNIVHHLRVEVTKLELHLEPYVEVERAILTKVLLHPHLVANNKEEHSHQHKSSSSKGHNSVPFLIALIEHTKKLTSEHLVGLQLDMLVIFQDMIHPTVATGQSQILSRKLLTQFFEDRSEDGGISLYDDDEPGREVIVQNLLDRCGCAWVVILLMMTNKNNQINQEAMKLGIALLENGNSQLQESFFKRFNDSETSAFFANTSSAIAMARQHITVQSDVESAVMERARNTFRILQLFCEHHHTGLQNFVRQQVGNATSYNLVQDTTLFLDFYGLSLYICETNVGSITQALETLTEFCQGPCLGNQDCIASYESNGIDLIVQELLLVELSSASLSKQALKEKEEMFVSIRRYAAITLLSAMESRPASDHGIHDRILLSMHPELLIGTITKLYSAAGSTPNSDSRCENDECSCPSCQRDVGHTMYLLALTLSAHDEQLHTNLNGDLINAFDWDTMKAGSQNRKTIQDVVSEFSSKDSKPAGRDSMEEDDAFDSQEAWLTAQSRHAEEEALNYYAQQTNRIEIFRDGQFETVVFPIPSICWYLTPSTRVQIVNETEVDNEDSKVPDFFVRSSTLQDEMKWQKKLTSARYFHVITVEIAQWQLIGTVSSWLQNVLIALCYPFTSTDDLAVSESICHNLAASPTHSVLSWLWLLGSAGLSVFIYIYATPKGESSEVRYPGLQSYQSTTLIVFASAWLYRMVLSSHLTLASVMIGVAQLINSFVLLLAFLGTKMSLLLKGIRDNRRHRDWTEHHEHSVDRSMAGSAPAPMEMLRCVSPDVLTNWLYYVAYFCVCLLGLLWQVMPFAKSTQYGPFWYSILLIDFIMTNPILQSVIEAVTIPMVQLMLTFLLAVILVYYFSIFGYMFLKADYVIDGDQDGESTPVCNTLFRCMVNTFHHGLRDGGGIGDSLKAVDWGDPTYSLRVAFDMVFWIICILIVLNLLLGVIIDTFADQRKSNEDEQLRNKNTCFICGINRIEFDANSACSFDAHTEKIHNKWAYLNFLVLLRTKDHTELTGPESACHTMITMPEPNLSFFPRLRKNKEDEEHDD